VLQGSAQAEEVCQSSSRVPGMAMLEPDEQVIILASPPRNLKCIQNDFSQGQLEPAGDLSRCAVADRRVLLGAGCSRGEPIGTPPSSSGCRSRTGRYALPSLSRPAGHAATGGWASQQGQ
jgi:hypothetical protein